MIAFYQFFLNLLIAFHLLGSDSEYVESWDFDVRCWVQLSMGEKLNKLWGDQFKVIFVAVGIVACKHFLLGFNEVKHEAL